MTTSPQPQNLAMAQQPVIVQTVIPGHQQFVPGGQQPQVFQPKHHDRRNRSKGVLYGLGITECVMGSISILLAVVVIVMTPSEASNYINSQRSYNSYYYYIYVVTVYSYTSQGIWSGLFMVILGILGVCAKSTPSRCMYIANMVIAIVAANIVFSGAIISCVGAGVSYYSGSLVALHSVIAVLCFVGSILTIVHSAFCCGGLCCNNDSPPVRAVYVASQANPQPQYIQGPNGQLLMVINQPMAGDAVPQAPPYQQFPTASPTAGSQIPAPVQYAPQPAGISYNSRPEATPSEQPNSQYSQKV